MSLAHYRREYVVIIADIIIVIIVIIDVIECQDGAFYHEKIPCLDQKRGIRSTRAQYSFRFLCIQAYLFARRIITRTFDSLYLFYYVLQPITDTIEEVGFMDIREMVFTLLVVR